MDGSTGRKVLKEGTKQKNTHTHTHKKWRLDWDHIDIGWTMIVEITAGAG
jgi:hypothetical protein